MIVDWLSWCNLHHGKQQRKCWYWYCNIVKCCYCNPFLKFYWYWYWQYFLLEVLVFTEAHSGHVCFFAVLKYTFVITATITILPSLTPYPLGLLLLLTASLILESGHCNRLNFHLRTLLIYEYCSLLNDLNILDISTWPVWADKVNDKFGCSSVKGLCKCYGLNEMKHDVMDGFRDFTNCSGRRASPKLKFLLDCVKTLPCSTADSESGFSAMNMIITRNWSNLLLSHVSSLIFIRLNGLPSSWNSNPYVKTWLLYHTYAIDSQARQRTFITKKRQMRPNFGHCVNLKFGWIGQDYLEV
jgi:hypothetical protein